MTNKPDDLAALRAIIDALGPFDARDQERIVRWACEKLGIASPQAGLPSPLAQPVPAQPALSTPVAAAGPTSRRDLRTFIAEKAPASDMHFATAVAYFYQFEAPESERKYAITSADLLEACRLADRRRLRNAGQTLRNALQDGLLDRAEPGAFKINTVGENLVAMALPAGGKAKRKVRAKAKPRRPKKPKRRSTARGAKKTKARVKRR